MNFVSTRFLRLKILSSRYKYTPTKEFHISACGLKDKGFTERYKPCEKVKATGKSLSEALLFAEHGDNMLCTKIVLNVGNNFCTQHVLPRFELGIFMY